MTEVHVGDRMTTTGVGGRGAVATTLSERVVTGMTVDDVPIVERIRGREIQTGATAKGIPGIRTGVRDAVARRRLIERLSTMATFRLGIRRSPLL
jgi:hypothetical protein